MTDEPKCPKHCDVATAPEPVPLRSGWYVCVACGTEFRWPVGGQHQS